MWAVINSSNVTNRRWTPSDNTANTCRGVANDRAAAMSRRGDVFVTTWQTVATRVRDNRNVRKEGETNPSDFFGILPGGVHRDARQIDIDSGY